MLVCFVCWLYLFYRLSYFFFFNDTATTEIYTLSLHDALPISVAAIAVCRITWRMRCRSCVDDRDRKSTRLNSSHPSISYAVFCLKKKKNDDKLRHQIVNYSALDHDKSGALELHTRASIVYVYL